VPGLPGSVTTVSDLTERELIARLQQQLAPAPPWMVVGIGDDAAVVEPVRNQLEVLTVDAIVEGIHFDRRFTPADAIGHRALAVNLSDLAAMGATPRLALLSFALPPALPTDDFDAIVSGLAALARTHRVHVAGGNLTRSPGPLVLDVTAIGSAKRRGVLTRSGARPGDEIYVTGTVGGARAGLQCLQMRANAGSGSETNVGSRTGTGVGPSIGAGVGSGSGTVLGSGIGNGVGYDTGIDVGSACTLNDSGKGGFPPTPKAPARHAEAPSGREGGSRTSLAMASAIHRYLHPEPRVRVGVLLGRNRAASACMDLSDGLADGLRQVAEASGVGVAIDPGALPIDPSARDWFESRGTDPLAEALAGGDDYELVFTVSPKLRRRLRAVARQAGTRFTRIGVCTPELDLRLRDSSGDRPIDMLLPRGFSHFR
jgi:thiamine monophosphate kinase